MDDLFTEIRMLIARKHEGDFWDYKEEHHKCKAELLHDIICLTNTLSKENRYIIFGVRDDGSIIGIENDENRKRQADIIDFLRSKNFAGQYRPEIELHTLHMEDHDLDVLLIHNSLYTPIYLSEDYADRKNNKTITVHANYIYSRIGDTNTPINQSADLYIVEKLWKKRFGLDLPPLERMNILLENIDDWDMDIGNRNYGYCKISPEYRIEMTDLHSCTEPCGYFYLHPDPCMGLLKIVYHSTIMYEENYWGFDGAHLIVPEFELRSIKDGDELRYFYYYVVNSLNGRLLKLFTNGTYSLSSRHTENCFILFSYEWEADSFIKYASANFDRVREIEPSPACRRAMMKEEENGKMGITAEDAWRIKQLHYIWSSERLGIETNDI
ncbi:MAG: ATP-binding protein [Clostridiales bacterium]|nr:ATP-binding protein [Clostridiales bacterium]